MDYFVPSVLNDLMGEAEQDAKAVLDTLAATPDGGVVDSSAFIAADGAARQKLELSRRGRFALMFETLTDKYDNAVRTAALMEDVAAGRRSFVLFLRGFSMKQMFRPDMTERHEADMEEYKERFELAKSLAPTAMVMVRNPATSESLIGVFPGAAEAAENTFAMDLDDGWEGDVEALVRAASFIVVRNKLPGAGLDAEMAMLQRLGRIDDTFFTHPVDADDLGGARTHALDAGALARMRDATAAGAPSGLPSPPTCLWIQGDRRRRVGDNAFFIFDYLNSCADRGQSMPRDMQGRLLFSATAASIGLERLDFLIMTLSSYAQVVSMYSPDELPDPAPILRTYGTVVSAIAQAIEADPDAAATFDFRDLSRLQTLMRSGEDAAQLIRASMDAIERMPERLRS